MVSLLQIWKLKIQILNQSTNEGNNHRAQPQRVNIQEDDIEMSMNYQQGIEILILMMACMGPQSLVGDIIQAHLRMEYN